jgi:hypothetical protein
MSFETFLSVVNVKENEGNAICLSVVGLVLQQ